MIEWLLAKVKLAISQPVMVLSAFPVGPKPGRASKEPGPDYLGEYMRGAGPIHGEALLHII